MPKGNKILIVDDEPIVRILIEQVLLIEGYEFKSVESGEEALEVLSSFDPDIILLDIQMVGMDGYSVCAQIRDDERYRFTKIIMVSGCAQVEERLKGYEAGADDYIAKPFDNGELLAKVKVYTRLKRREEIDQVKGDLLTLLTHETRTPINGIIGCADLLAGDQSLTEEQLEFVSMISESAYKLHGFLENCLLLSKLKAGVELMKSQETMEDILRAVCLKISREYNGKCTFELDIDHGLLLYADWQLLKRAFELVLDNSAKYSPEGGVVLVKVEMDDHDCRIIIDDSGIGVDPKRRQDIFEEFSIKDVTHHQRGQGISLAITNRICICHGGDISVLDNPAGNGSRFILTIPQPEDDPDG
jgi:signal transduction histidine kinase